MKQGEKNTSGCKLTIAGPGAGKTYSMVEDIIHNLQLLSPSRYLVVITYTNSATANILDRLKSKIVIPKNVFIGTIHGFLNNFIIIPHASLINNNVKTDKFFLQCSSENLLPSKKLTPQAKNFHLSNIASTLNKKGLITFDQTVKLSVETIQNDKTCEIISKKIQYLFIDEFQDTDNMQFEIVEKIRKRGRTKIFLVGDPEQYISGYSNTIKFVNIPILKCVKKNDYQIEFNRNNVRCSQTIINFLNLLNATTYRTSIFQQVKADFSENHSNFPVQFHNEENLEVVVSKFIAYCKNNNIYEDDIFILAKENKIVNKIQNILSSSRTLEKNKLMTDLEIAQNFILTVSQKLKKEFLSENHMSEIDFRKLCMKLLKAIGLRQIYTIEGLRNYLINNLNITIMNDKIIKLETFDFLLNNTTKKNILVSNIHNAKGLEARAVLCFTTSEEELLDWLETDAEKRKQESKNRKNKSDRCRLGYVAFSRAKEILRIICLEEVTQDTINKINHLNISMI